MTTSSSALPVARVRRLEIFVVALWVAAVVAATIQQGITHQNNNFLIFRAASQHLLHGQDLYAAYPTEHFDFYKYSPTFALLFLPFAFPPLPAAMLLWNALNAGALYAAIGTVLPRRVAIAARAIVFLDMLGSLQNVQSNALVAALIVLTFAAYERRHTVLGSLATGIGTNIKVFPLAGASFAIFHPRKARVAVALIASLVVLAALPLLVTTPSRLFAQYASWRAIETTDALERGFSVMYPVQLLLQRNWPNWPFQLLGVALLLAPVLLRRERWAEWGFRRLYLCSVLAFCVLFNHQAESPTFVIGATGVALWFASLERRTRWRWTLFVFFVVGTMLASSEAMPNWLQEHLFDPYRFKTVPLLLVWIEMQRQLWAHAAARSQLGERHHSDVAASEPRAHGG
jgi:hypothetical protein